MTDDEDVECVSIPRKLLEDIYQDYIMFTGCYFTDLKEEAMKMRDDCYWQPSEVGAYDERFNRIKFYLEQ